MLILSSARDTSLWAARLLGELRGLQGCDSMNKDLGPEKSSPSRFRPPICTQPLSPRQAPGWTPSCIICCGSKTWRSRLQAPLLPLPRWAPKTLGPRISKDPVQKPHPLPAHLGAKPPGLFPIRQVCQQFRVTAGTVAGRGLFAQQRVQLNTGFLFNSALPSLTLWLQ